LPGFETGFETGSNRRAWLGAGHARPGSRRWRPRRTVAAAPPRRAGVPARC